MNQAAIFTLLYLLGVFLFWYTLYQPRVWHRGLADAISSFKRDIQFYGFGGFARRRMWVYKSVQRATKLNILDQGAIAGRARRIWTYREIHETACYDACTYDCFDPPWRFWLAHVVAPILWPVVLPLKIVYGFIKFVALVLSIRFRKNSA